MNGDGHDQALPRAEVPADDRGARLAAAQRHAAGEVDDPVHRRGARQHEARDERDRPGAHGGDIGQVLGGGAGPDVEAARPVGAEVAALDEHVGAHAVAPVRGGQDRAVVPRAHQDVAAGGQERGDAREEPGLAEVGDDGSAHRLTSRGRSRARSMSSVTSSVYPRPETCHM